MREPHFPLPMSITKAHLIDSVFNRLDTPKTTSNQLVDTVLEIIKETLESGEDVLISGFGKFEVKDKHKRRGRNPQTGDDLMLNARRAITFKCSGVLREKVNGKR